MSKKRITIFLVSAAILLGGCKQQGASVSSAPAAPPANADPNDAIRTAIRAHLAHNGNLRLDSFDTTVKQIAVDGDHAQAQVEFHAKGGPGTMQLTYALAKRNSTWYVVESNPGGSNFSHPALDGFQTPSHNGTTGAESSVFRMLDNLHGRTGANSQNPHPAQPAVASREEKQSQAP